MKTSDFAASIVQFQNELWRYAIKITGDREEANDLLQETFLKVLSNESKFLPDSNLKQWIYTVMRNLFINNYRRSQRCCTFSQNENVVRVLTESCSREIHPIEDLYDIKEMYRLVNALPSEYRIPFIMYVSGFKYREISEKLNLPIGTIKSRIFITRKKLQLALKDFR